MWLLTGIRDENQDQVYYIYQSREHTVSRKGGDVTLANDQSISRLHAKIIHGTQDENQILVMDAGSKYGTFLLEDNDEKKKLVADEAIIAKSGSILQFGLQWNVFRLDYMPLVVCPSTLNSAEKSQLKGIVQALNGQLVSDWQENTTHLTMNKITLTVKVVCALGYGKPIVNLEFWNALKNAVETNTKLPNYENYTPPLVEKALHKSKVSFTIDLGRRTLFAGKTFIACCPAQKQRLENMVIAAEKDCKKRCTNIRTVFCRHFNQKTPSGSVPGAKKDYYLNESLQFLVPVIQTITSQVSNLDATEGTENNDGEASQEAVFNESEGGDNNNDPVSPMSDVPEEDEAESQLMAGNENQESGNIAEPNTSNTTDFQNNTERPNSKRKDPVGAAIINYLANKKKKASDTPKPEYDRDETFLLSLKDDMREMTPSQRRTFKRRILEVVEDTLQEQSSSSSGTFHPISVSTPRSTTPG